MRVPVTAGVGGKFRIMELHPDTNKPITGRGGVPIVRDEFGRARPVGQWHRNLITDQGLDWMASKQWLGRKTTTVAFRRYLHIGTDATPPAAADTVLGAEVAMTSDAGGFPDVLERADDETYTTYSSQATFVYTAAEAVNVRELGLGGTTADIGVRFLPTDGEGDPVTVSLTEGKKLRVDHTGELRQPLVTAGVAVDVVEYDVGGNVVTTREFTANIYAIRGVINSVTQPGIYEWNAMHAREAILDELPAVGAFTGDLHGFRTRDTVSPAYVPGEFSWAVGGGLSEVQGNGTDWRTFAIGKKAGSGTGFIEHGFVVALQDGSHPKDDLHVLDVFLDLTWGRI